MRSTPRNRPALDAAGLERLALGYAGRYATSRAKLRDYLVRKVSERGWSEANPPDCAAISDRFASLGYVDDAGLAEARGRALARRGLGRRRVAQALARLGIAPADGAAALATAESAAWDTALRYAERRRLGPFAAAAPDEAGRRRAFAAMVRAGHGIDHVRKIIAADPGAVPDRNE